MLHRTVANNYNIQFKAVKNTENTKLNLIAGAFEIRVLNLASNALLHRQKRKKEPTLIGYHETSRGQNWGEDSARAESILLIIRIDLYLQNVLK